MYLHTGDINTAWVAHLSIYSTFWLTMFYSIESCLWCALLIPKILFPWTRATVANVRLVSKTAKRLRHLSSKEGLLIHPRWTDFSTMPSTTLALHQQAQGIECMTTSTATALLPILPSRIVSKRETLRPCSRTCNKFFVFFPGSIDTLHCTTTMCRANIRSTSSKWLFIPLKTVAVSYISQASVPNIALRKASLFGGRPRKSYHNIHSGSISFL